MTNRNDRIARLHAIAKERILMLDGSWGVMIQRKGLEEADYRGERFADYNGQMQGNNDILCLTRPDLVTELHDAYFAAGADISETNTFSATVIAQDDYKLDADTVRDIMELEAEYEESRHGTGRKIMDQLGAFAPAFGMIGTLVGLVPMLQDLSDPNGIGLGMATALLTTLYGAMGANMVFIPLAGKLEMVTKTNAEIRKLMIEGIVAIQSGEKPQLIKGKLKGFLAPPMRALVDAGS